jgi:hypothetical protein
MLASRLLEVPRPPNLEQGLGYAALIVVGVIIVTALLVTLISVVLHYLHEEDERRHRHIH